MLNEKKITLTKEERQGLTEQQIETIESFLTGVWETPEEYQTRKMETDPEYRKRVEKSEAAFGKVFDWTKYFKHDD